MSSEWMITSPSHVGLGPGGCLDESTSALNRANASAGELPRSRAMSLRCMLVMLKPDAISFGKNAPPLILAVAVMCATTSRTVHSVHSVGAAHCSSLRPANSVASALRSAWIVGHVSLDAIVPNLPVFRLFRL